MKVRDLFSVKHGVNLELMRCETANKSDTDTVNFVARTAENNGVVAVVKRIDGVTPHPTGIITCAAHGSVMSSFVQTKPFYSGRALYVLTPLKEMSLPEKLFYCMCLKANAYRYSYGRSAETTLRDIELPDTIPEWVYSVPIVPLKTKISHKILPFNTDDWHWFMVGDFFMVKRGRRIVKDKDYFSEKTDEYCYSVITSTQQNNGVNGYYHSYNCPENSLICCGEAAGMFTTYQPKECWVMDSARILTPKKDISLNKYTALYLSTVLCQNQYKYSYGRSPNPDDIQETMIKLPTTPDGTPDWQYMENYIKSLPYSMQI